MKRHRLGVDKRSNLSNFAQHDTGLVHLEPGHVRHQDLQLRIVSNELVVRVQDWMILPEAEIAGRHTPITIRGWAALCTHASSYRLGEMLRCRCKHWDRNFQCSFCDGFQQCKYCHTEYQLDTKRMGEYVGFEFAKWRNYGGELTRLDPK